MDHLEQWSVRRTKYRAEKLLQKQLTRRSTCCFHLPALDELQQAFDKALKDNDLASATLLVKVAERHATLLGLNPPLGHAPVSKPTSSARIRAVLDQEIGKPSLALPCDGPDDPPATH
jgi:hypothetical protein